MCSSGKECMHLCSEQACMCRLCVQCTVSRVHMWVCTRPEVGLQHPESPCPWGSLRQECNAGDIIVLGHVFFQERDHFRALLKCVWKALMCASLPFPGARCSWMRGWVGAATIWDVQGKPWALVWGYVARGRSLYTLLKRAAWGSTAICTPARPVRFSQRYSEMDLKKANYLSFAFH